MKRKTAILIVTEILWFMIAIFFWFMIWKLTGLQPDDWKFWILLFSITGLILAHDIKNSIIDKL